MITGLCLRILFPYFRADIDQRYPPNRIDIGRRSLGAQVEVLVFGAYLRVRNSYVLRIFRSRVYLSRPWQFPFFFFTIVTAIILIYPFIFAATVPDRSFSVRTREPDTASYRLKMPPLCIPILTLVSGPDD